MSAVVVPRSPVDTPTDRSPYVGLSYYTENEADLFFGRDADASILIGNLRASRLTLLYAESGVGKSSVLRAAVAARLHQLARRDAELRGTPRFVPVVFNVWSSEPVSALVDAIEQALSPFRDEAQPALPRDRLEHAVEAATAGGTSLLVILDQFEEHFVYRTEHNGREPFAQQLARCVNRADLRMNVLISIREDSYAGVGDLFGGLIPNLYANSVHLDYLDRKDGREAITGPIRKLNDSRPRSEQLELPEAALVEAVLDGVRRGVRERADVRDTAEINGSGQQVERPEPAPSQIETTYLQLVMTRLWGEETTRRLRLATLKDLGGTDQIIDAHLDRALDALPPREQDTAASIFTFLVTRAGTKIALTAKDLSELSGLPESKVDPVLRRLAASESHILRPVDLRDQGRGRAYEIFHDALARPIVEWRQAKLNARLAEDARREASERMRRLAIIVVIALVALATMFGLLLFALSATNEARAQRAEAREQARTARARELAAIALTQLDTDPERSVVLAAAAAGLEPTPRIEAILVRALVASRVRAKLSVGEDPVESVEVVDRRIVAAVHGGVVVTKPPNLREVVRWGLDGEVVGTHGGLLLVSRAAGLELRSPQDGRLVRKLPLRPGDRVPIRDVNSGDVVGQVDLPERFEVAAVGPRGTMVAVSDGTRRMVVANTLNGEARYVLEQESSVTTLAFGPGARILASGGKDGTARLWRVATGSQFARLGGHNSWVTDVAFSPRATYVATASRDGTARVWAIGKAEPVSVLANHRNPILDISFSPDGNLIVTASSDRTARVWKAITGAQQSVLAGHTETVTGAKFLSNDEVVTASADGTLRRWDVVNARKLQPVISGLPPIARAEMVESRRIEVTTTDGRRRLVDLEGNLLEQGTAGPTRPIRSVLGTTAKIDGSAVILRPPGKDEIRLEGHTHPVTSVRFSTDGARVVTASRDADARIWDAGTGDLLHTLRGHFNIVSDASFSPDGRWVVTAGPQTAGLWDASSGAHIFFLYGHDDILTSASFDRSGRTIVTGSRDGEVRFYQCNICVGGVELLRTADKRSRSTGAITPKPTRRDTAADS